MFVKVDQSLFQLKYSETPLYQRLVKTTLLRSMQITSITLDESSAWVVIHTRYSKHIETHFVQAGTERRVLNHSVINMHVNILQYQYFPCWVCEEEFFVSICSIGLFKASPVMAYPSANVSVYVYNIHIFQN